MIRQRTSPLLALAVSVILGAFTVADAQPIRKATDIVSQVAYLKVRGDPLGFRVPVNSVILSGTNHWQGIVRHPDPAKPYFYAVSSRESCTELHVIRIGTSDSKSGYRIRSNRLDPDNIAIATAPPAADRVINTIALPDAHAGGMQAAGKYLAIPLGDYEHCDSVTDPYEQQPRIAIYDISNPAIPVLARMLHDQDDTNYYAGWPDADPPVPAYNSIPGSLSVLSFVQRDDGSYFLLGNFSSNLWNWTLSADLSTFTRHSSYTLDAEDWPGGGNGYSFQSFQLINPLGETTTDGNEVLYMLGLQNFSGAGILADYVWLYRMQLSSDGTIQSMQKISQTEISSRTAAESPQMNGNFAAGGSAWISPTGSLLLYSCEHYISGLGYSVTMSEFCDRSGDSPATVPADGCTAQVHLYTNADFGGKVLTVDALDYEMKNYLNLLDSHEGAGGFANNVSSLTWRLPAGCTARLYNGNQQNGAYIELSGAGSLSDLGGVAWTSSGAGNSNNAINSVAFIGATTPAPARFVSPVPAGILNPMIPLFPCAMLKLSEGDYPGAGVINRRVELRSTGGLVRIGAQ